MPNPLESVPIEFNISAFPPLNAAKYEHCNERWFIVWALNAFCTVKRNCTALQCNMHGDTSRTPLHEGISSLSLLESWLHLFGLKTPWSGENESNCCDKHKYRSWSHRATSSLLAPCPYLWEKNSNIFIFFIVSMKILFLPVLSNKIFSIFICVLYSINHSEHYACISYLCDDIKHCMPHTNRHTTSTEKGTNKNSPLVVQRSHCVSCISRE